MGPNGLAAAIYVSTHPHRFGGKDRRVLPSPGLKWLWSASRKESRLARTVVLKLKTSEFKILTRGIEPALIVFHSQDCRHAVANIGHKRVRLGGQDGASFDDVVFRISPPVPQSRKRK